MVVYITVIYFQDKKREKYSSGWIYNEDELHYISNGRHCGLSLIKLPHHQNTFHQTTPLLCEHLYRGVGSKRLLVRSKDWWCSVNFMQSTKRPRGCGGLPPIEIFESLILGDHFWIHSQTNIRLSAVLTKILVRPWPNWPDH